MFLDDESGQAITEYGAIIAFVSFIVAIVFSFGQGTLGPAVQGCYSSVCSALNDLAAAGAASS
jgi:Flp pilus assembly pilin Flp